MGLLITGVAGLIGANLSAALLKKGRIVLGIDDLSLGRKANITAQLRHPHFKFKVADLASEAEYRKAVNALLRYSNISEVWHLAANSDIRAGTEDPDIDFRNTFLTTYNTLKIMRELSVATIAFASSSAVYGDHDRKILSEISGPLCPISNYGAMKLAAEASISAASDAFLKRAIIFRFPNVVGMPATHGVVFDFINKLKRTPGELQVLGDGFQRKPYLFVDDLVDAMLLIRRRSKSGLELFNIGPNDTGVSVKFIAKEVVAACAPGARIRYGRGAQGWTGDVPVFRYSTAKLSRLGWKPTRGSREAIQLAVRQIAASVRARS